MIGDEPLGSGFVKEKFPFCRATLHFFTILRKYWHKENEVSVNAFRLSADPLKNNYQRFIKAPCGGREGTAEHSKLLESKY